MGFVQPGTSPGGPGELRQGAKNISSGRHRCDEHPTGRIVKIRHRVDCVLRHEHETSTIHVAPHALKQEGTSSPLGQKDFVFISLVLRRRPAPGFPKSQLSSGLRAARMNDNLSMERMQTMALLAGDRPQPFPSVRKLNKLGRPTRDTGAKQTSKP